jgi:hypothetical protein
MSFNRGMRRLSTLVDVPILVLCLPFYAVAIPAMRLVDWRRARRPIHVGLEINSWYARDIREDRVAIDLSRLSEGLVGVKRRRWCVLRYVGPPPPYPDRVQYISRREFWK